MLQWLPAIEAIAMERDWQITVYLKSSCPFIEFAITYRDKQYDECVAFVRNSLRAIEASPPDLAFYGMRAGYASGDLSVDQVASEITSAVKSVWARLDAAGVRIIPVRDTPLNPYNMVSCLERRPDCSFALDKARPAIDSIVAAALATNRPVLDPTDLVCPNRICSQIIGNVYVWRENSHITSTYARTAAHGFTLALKQRFGL